ncbi:microfibril-associated glycoprotein 4-like [Zophobas morio]|uniref:microfibril-associated glycoprotein 4-like n=1 Tax=Zophobas morio TaxID=2755281 RepID=UPI0030827748
MNAYLNLQYILVLTATFNNLECEVVSTTEHPSETSRSDILLNITRRLDILESQNVKIMAILNTQPQKNADPHQSTADYPTDCQDVKSRGHGDSGVYTIQTKIWPQPFAVFCDMDTRGGGWTYFLHRFDGSRDFYLKWNDYKIGFGSLVGEHWLGLEYLHQITASGDYEMLVKMADWDNKVVYAHYKVFVVGSENEGYVLKAVSGYSGDAGDSMYWYSGMKFTTQDKDQDMRNNSNCAIDEHGAWWYNQCTRSNPTAMYLKKARDSGIRWKIMYWGTFRDSDYSLKRMTMMVRPRRDKNLEV